jgi:hypothetical protein
MDIDGSIEHHRTIVPLKNHKDCFLMGDLCYQHRNLDNFSETSNTLLPKRNEIPKHAGNSYDTHSDIYADRGQNLKGLLPRKHTKVFCDTVKRNGVVCNQAWTELGDNGEYHFSQEANTDNTYNLLQSVNGFTARQDVCFCDISVENHDCDHSCPRNDERGTIPSRQRFVADTAHDCYLHEVEVLGSKLRELRGGVDGKRLRQRSESEPGAGFGGSSQDSSWEPKRARDGSPGLTENLGHSYVEDTKHLFYAQHQLQGSDSHSSHLQVIHLRRPSAHRGHDTKVSSE